MELKKIKGGMKVVIGIPDSFHNYITMDKYVGKVGRVHEICEESVGVEFYDGLIFYYGPRTLSKFKKKPNKLYSIVYFKPSEESDALIKDTICMGKSMQWTSDKNEAKIKCDDMNSRLLTDGSNYRLVSMKIEEKDNG